jgi:hypothetical protein
MNAVVKRSWLAVLGALVTAVVLVPAVPASAAPYCGLTWGSLPESAGPDTTPSKLTDVRTGRHECWDRAVFDLNGPASGYDVRYVDQLLAEGSGNVIPLAGGAKLAVVVRAASHDDNGNTTYPGVTGRTLPGVNVTGYSTFRDTKFAGSFEGQTTIGIGVRAKLPFRVFKLDNRLVLDVAHFW